MALRCQLVHQTEPDTQHAGPSAAAPTRIHVERTCGDLTVHIGAPYWNGLKPEFPAVAPRETVSATGSQPPARTLGAPA